MGRYDLRSVVSKPRPTGATNNIAAPDQAEQIAAVQAQVTNLPTAKTTASGQYATFEDPNGVVRVRIGLLASGRYGLALYNADGTLNNETNSVPA